MSRELRRVPMDLNWPDDPRIQWDELFPTPPEGDGWQAWETVSEGSPCSPVFATAEELIEWAAGPDGKLGIGGRPVSREAAAAFVAEGYAVSMVFTPRTGLVGGVEYLASEDTTP
jgi:hypothetical protein